MITLAKPFLVKIKWYSSHPAICPKCAWCAGWISRITNPPLLTAIALIYAAYWLGTDWGWAEAIGYGLIALLLPTLYVAWLVRCGKVTDLHLRVREQRIKPYLFAVSCMAISYWLLLQLHAPFQLSQLARINLFQTGLLMLITFRWKISAHTTGAMAICIWAYFTLGQATWPLFLIIPCVAWSRLYLQRHDLGQVIGGTCLGALTVTALTYL